MNESEIGSIGIELIIGRLLISALIGAMIGYERHLHRKAIGIMGMVLVAVGSTTYMLLAKHLSVSDPAALSRAIQGVMQGIGFLGGAVIFKGGTNVKGIKTAAAIWIMGAIGLAVGTGFWVLGLIIGVTTAIALFIADLIPVPVPEELEEAVADKKAKEAVVADAETKKVADKVDRDT